MTCQTLVHTLIKNNQWEPLEEFLLNSRGIIGRSAGGRYCYHVYQGYLDLNLVCWHLYDAIRMDSSNRLTASRVIHLLRLLHDQTEEALSSASYVQSIATRLYDLREKIYDGFLPIERLENSVLPALDSII